MGQPDRERVAVGCADVGQGADRFPGRGVAQPDGGQVGDGHADARQPVELPGAGVDRPERGIATVGAENGPVGGVVRGRRQAARPVSGERLDHLVGRHGVLQADEAEDRGRVEQPGVRGRQPDRLGCVHRTTVAQAVRDAAPWGRGTSMSTSIDQDERKAIRSDFRDAVNMSPKELEEWLETDKSQSVGDSGGDGESTGHASGRRIVKLKRAAVDDLTDDDHEHMKKVVGYVHRHLGQGGPAGDVEHSRWRYSLMNWGHDPLK